MIDTCIKIIYACIVLCVDSHSPPSSFLLSQVFSMSSESIIIDDVVVHPLWTKWTLYYHLPNDNNWALSGYKVVVSEMDSLEHLIALNRVVTERMVKYSMLFFMRDGVTPLWEDKQNRTGGCFSYKVPNKAVYRLWNDLVYLMCGNTLMVNPDHMHLVNGITVSPKRNFCIVKIWMMDCTLQDPNVIVHVPNLLHAGCLFKSHFGSS
jgi:hypothetical protein